jgi:predicted RNA-binding Zn-ribbon protein involved in translation (DUF1610 family)
MPINSESFQKVYYLNCPKCGEIVKVVNPKLNKEPIRVSQNGSDDAATEYVVTVCSSCKNELEVFFSYK